MIEQHQVDNGNFIIPPGAQYPTWVIERINQFKEMIYSISKTSKEPNEEVQKQLVKALENFILPKGVKISKTLTKPEVANLLKDIDKATTEEDFSLYVWLLMNAGFYLSTLLPICIDEDSLTIPEPVVAKRLASIKKFNETGNKQAYLSEIEEIAKEVFEYMVSIDNAFGDFLQSKANGTLDHVQELLVGVGLALNSKGEVIDTITNCLVEGVSQTDYFSKGSTGIVALHSKSIMTAAPGYLGKKLSNICEKVKLANEFDCGTKRRLKINTINPNFLSSFIGMFYSETPTGELKEFTQVNTKMYINKDIYFRSPFFCKTKGNYICKNCYNQDFIRKHNIKPGDNIGLYASTGILDSIISLTLKRSHVGINIKTEKVNFLKDLGIE